MRLCPRPLIWLFLLFAMPALAVSPANQLAGHPSPYLALHGKDPVAWQEWNAETLARAKRENKPLLVSVGYFACHWCHVMQRESYRDPAIAALLNRHFIPVKVDRELNGALDAALLAFAEGFSGMAGWPLNVLVTPEGYPAYAVLYLPPREFRDLLDRLARTWEARGEAFAAAAREAGTRRPGPPVRGEVSAEVAAELTESFLAAARQSADLIQGGFGPVSKFPRPAQLDFLLDLAARGGAAWVGEFLPLTLDHMAGLGLRDHVNGGFFRYTVDPDWMTPHFEKMLYDNAQLALLYHKAATALARTEYLGVARETLDFMLDTLKAPGGGFMTSTSALDAKGREGGAYLWTPEVLRKRLKPAEYNLVHKTWGMNGHPPFPQGFLPMLKTPPKAAEKRSLRQIHARLKALGRAREVPRDSKIGAGLNGLALSALSRAGKGVPRHEQAARELYGYLAGQMVVDGKLVKARAGDRVFPDAELDDYAYVVAGLRDYGKAFRDPAADRLAQSLMRQAWLRYFWQEGWRREERPLLATLVPEAAIGDDALPSPSAILIQAADEMGDAALKRQAAQALSMAVPVMRAASFDHPGGIAVLRASSQDLMK